MTIDLATTPFAMRGSWFGLNRLGSVRAAELGKPPGLFLRTYRGNVAMARREIARIDVGGAGKRVVERVTPGAARFTAGRGFAEAVFASPTVLVLHGRGLPVTLTIETSAYDYARPAGTQAWELNLFTQRIQFLLQQHRGRCEVEAPWDEQRSDRITIQLGGDGRPWRISLKEFEVTCPPTPPLPPVAALKRARMAEWRAFVAPLPAVPRQLSRAREYAGYVLWSALVAPSGVLAREAMLMSKNWMVNVWSWDHCFNAIALAGAHPDLAWDQWALLFDHQHVSGALPDTVNDRDLILNFTKPPVHGWAWREMEAAGWEPSSAQCRQGVRWLEAWTEWWMQHRDDDHDGLPQYNHGNDSGWDNATCFGAGMPVEGPDLATFLVVQMDVIAGLHRRLGQAARARSWTHRADRLVAKLLEHSWDGHRFVARCSGHHAVAEGDSLVLMMPLLLGHRLPPEVLRTLLRGIAEPGRYLGPYGLATEGLRSPLYRTDGYWRGPAWAPSTHLIACALEGVGETRLAREVARRFAAAFARSGAAENFDPVTGAGYRDRAYTWTASVFLTLAAKLESA